MLGEYDWLPFNGGNLNLDFVEEAEVVAQGVGMTWLPSHRTLWMTSHGSPLNNIWWVAGGSWLGRQCSPHYPSIYYQGTVH
jgi:hypothetical protein